MANRYDDFMVEDLGIQEIDVYDIEVENNHNFFANNICVHNSCYVSYEALVNKLFGSDQSDKTKIVEFLDKLSNEKIIPLFEKSYEELTEYLGSFQNCLEMKREIISDNAFWTAKKRYAMNVWDKEGKRYTSPELKIMGIEVVKSSTPKFCRNNLKEAIRIILNSDNDTLIQFIDKTYEDFIAQPVENIAFPRGVSDIDAYQTKDYGYGAKCPIHVRAAITHNKFIVDNKLKTRYNLIRSGDKIRYIHLNTPNRYHENVIGFIDTPPKEFELERFVDYKTQFQKSFLDPLEIITNAINWKTERESQLSSIFF